MATFFVNFLFLLLLSGFPALFRRNCLLPSLTAFAAGETSPPSAAEGHRPVLPKAAAAAAAAAADGAASRSLLDRVLAAMEMGLEFMEREEEALNLDAIIGSRIVEGQLTVLMMRLEGTENNPLSLPTETVKRIESIRQLADRISTKAIPSIKRKQPIYYNRLSAILRRGFWALSYGTRRANTSAVVPPIVDGEAMNEEESDDCLTELFGTGGETQERCRVSVGCWRLMTQPGFQHYALTHQVFYTEIGTSFGCFSGDLRKFTDELSFGFCANILVEAEAIASANFPYHKTDLFMEQAALCGVLGFREFFRPHWLEAILLWQRHPDGCWGENHSPRSSTRYRREERVLVGGCRCHRTAVALGALVGYVRFLSESVSNSRNSPNEYHHHQHHYHHQHHHHHHHHQQQ